MTAPTPPGAHPRLLCHWPRFSVTCFLLLLTEIDQHVHDRPRGCRPQTAGPSSSIGLGLTDPGQATCAFGSPQALRDR